MLNLHTMTTFTCKQKMRRSQNKEEQKRILMDLEVVMKCHSCPFIVNCLGSYISRVSPLLLMLKVTDFCSSITFVSCFKTGCFFPVSSECSVRILFLCKEMLSLILDIMMTILILLWFYLHVFVYYFGSLMCLFVWN